LARLELPELVLVLFEPEILIFPLGSAVALSSRESNWSVLLTLIVASGVFALVVLGLDTVVKAIFVLVVPLVVDNIGDLTVVVVAPLLVLVDSRRLKLKKMQRVFGESLE
jgi:hypothetical protein